MATVTLDVQRLTKRFGSRLAVQEVSFTARRGDVVGLLGPNGAGKTTTIRLLATVLAPTSGTFSVGGIPSGQPSEIRRRVGVLPESAGYPAHQTGTDFLRYHARLFGRSRSDAARVAARLLQEVGLDERASSRISTYSRGMRQRLGIARALVNDPVVVFLDEPTLGLDPAGQRQVLAILRDIAAGRGATVVLSTHTLPEVEAVCSTVLILDKGRVITSGTVGEVIRVVATKRSAQLRVPIDSMERTRQALAGIGGLAVDVAHGRPDVLTISMNGTGGRQRHTDLDMNAALRAVLSADVPVLGFEVEGTRLAEAFLAVTSGGLR